VNDADIVRASIYGGHYGDCCVGTRQGCTCGKPKRDASLAALDRLVAERDAIKEKFDHLHSEWQYGHDRGDHLIYESEWELFDAWQRGNDELVDRAEAAEAERDRLREALKEIQAEWFPLNGAPERMRGIARAALDGKP
jgi:predicted nuclease with TOPRIM domain